MKILQNKQRITINVNFNVYFDSFNRSRLTRRKLLSSENLLPASETYSSMMLSELLTELTAPWLVLTTRSELLVIS